MQGQNSSIPWRMTSYCRHIWCILYEKTQGLCLERAWKLRLERVLTEGLRDDIFRIGTALKNENQSLALIKFDNIQQSVNVSDCGLIGWLVPMICYILILSFSAHSTIYKLVRHAPENKLKFNENNEIELNPWKMTALNQQLTGFI